MFNIYNTRFEECIMHSLLWMLLHRCCKALSTFQSRRRRIVVATTRKQCQETPKSFPRASKIHPRRCQNRAKIAQGGQGALQERPRSAQERPKSAQERPKSAQERPKSAPRAPQERPRAPQERPRAPQEPLKSAQRRPRDPSGRHFDASQLEKATFEDDASRDSVETRVRNDFRSIFASCAKARTDKKRVKSVFTRFRDVASSSHGSASSCEEA